MKRGRITASYLALAMTTVASFGGKMFDGKREYHTGIGDINIRFMNRSNQSKRRKLQRKTGWKKNA